MEVLLNDVWMLAAIFSFVVLAYGAWLSFVASKLGRDSLGKQPALTDLSTRILGRESSSEAMDLNC